MAKFQFKAINADGKEQNGKIEAPDEASARKDLLSRGLTPVAIKIVKDAITVEELLAKVRGVPTKNVVAFTRNLATMLAAGITVLRALYTLEEQEEHPAFKTIIRDVADRVEGGESLSQAFGSHPKTFDRLFISLVRAGEVGGQLNNTLGRLADQLEFNEDLRKQVRSAMIYPIFVLTFAALAVIGIVIGVVPSFQQLYSKFDSELPALTQFLVGVTELLVPPDGKIIPVRFLAVIAILFGGPALGIALQRSKIVPPVAGAIFGILVTLAGLAAVYFLRDSLSGALISAPGGKFIATLFRLVMLFFVTGMLIASFRWTINTPGGRRVWDRFKLNVPMKIGKLVRKIIIVRYTSTLSTLLEAGVPAIEAYDITGSAVGNVIIEETVSEIRSEIEIGNGPVRPLRDSPYFEPMVVSMIEIGAESGQTSAMLERIAKRYDVDVKAQIAGLSKLIEPILLIALGAIVGFVMIALLMPIFSLWDTLNAQIT